jgi:predicted NBD/HSP70 family sugar kinase
MALAERWLGKGKNFSNEVFITISYSIAAGIIVDSELFRGSKGYAGEFGHIQVNDNGQKCTCGNYDCLELYVTLPLLIKEIRTRLSEYNGYSPLLITAGDVSNINKDLIIDSLKQGDKVVHEVMMYAGKLIGIALANLVNIINPSVVFLGGGVIESFPIIVDEVERTVKNRILSPIHNDLTIMKSDLGSDGAIAGICALAISRLFE